jgi:hypothetical protein
METILDKDKHRLWNEFKMRIIPRQVGPNHLRWGLRGGGKYYVKQAYTNLLN